MVKSDDTIYLLSNDDTLQRVERHHYESEDLLQTLIEKYPEILAGDQMGGDEPVRFLLVKREAGIPDDLGAAIRWAVDHLLLDQNAILTLVEVKRSSDTRIRREVVGQLLEYAANIDVYWPSDRIRSLAVAKYGGEDGLGRAILKLLKIDSEVDSMDSMDAIKSYWSQVDQNLRNGKLRLLFVADELPREVRRIIEFLNDKMKDVEVLGVELRQYVGLNLRALVPRVIGQTEMTRNGKGNTEFPKKPISIDAFCSVCPAEVRPYFNQMIADAEHLGLTVNWGIKGFSLRASMSDGSWQTLFYCWPPGLYSGTDKACVQGYIPVPLRGTELGKRFEEDLIKCGFKKNPAAKHTYQLDLTKETLESAQAALQVVWEVASKISKESVVL